MILLKCEWIEGRRMPLSDVRSSVLQPDELKSVNIGKALAV